MSHAKDQKALVTPKPRLVLWAGCCAGETQPFGWVLRWLRISAFEAVAFALDCCEVLGWERPNRMAVDVFWVREARVSDGDSSCLAGRVAMRFLLSPAMSCFAGLFFLAYQHLRVWCQSRQWLEAFLGA